MGHPLILVSAGSRMRCRFCTYQTAEFIEFLYGSSLSRRWMREWQGTTLGRQELKGEFIRSAEGEILRRSDWVYYPRSWSFYETNAEPRIRETAAVPADRLLLGYRTVDDGIPANYLGWAGVGRRLSQPYFLLRLFHVLRRVRVQGLTMIRSGLWMGAWRGRSAVGGQIDRRDRWPRP